MMNATNNFFAVGLFALGAAAILLFGLPNIFRYSGIAAPVILIGGVAVFFSIGFSEKSTKRTVSIKNWLHIGLFALSILVTIWGLVNIFAEGRVAASFYLFIVGLIGAFSAAIVARKA